MRSPSGLRVGTPREVSHGGDGVHTLLEVTGQVRPRRAPLGATSLREVDALDVVPDGPLESTVTLEKGSGDWMRGKLEGTTGPTTERLV